MPERVRGRPRSRRSASRAWSARTRNCDAPMRYCAPPALFRPSRARPQTEVVNAHIDRHRGVYGVKPICKVLQVAPSAYRRHTACQRDPDRRSARAKHDEELMARIERAWKSNLRVYGADTSAFDTPNAWPKRVSSLRSVAVATAMTMRWPRPSTGCTRRR